MLGLTEMLFLSFPLFGLAINNILNHNPEPIFNVYQRPNGFYWIKVIIMYILLSVKKLMNRMRMVLKNEEDLLKYHEELESIREPPSQKQEINGVHFNASNENGDHLIVGMTQRFNKLIDGYLYVKINKENIGLLESAKLPDTSLYQAENCEGFEAEGLSVECLEPMKTWRIKYRGEMKKNSDPSQNFQVDLDMTYTSDSPIIDYERDSDPLTTAKCIALERWSKEYFQLLKGCRQSQYQQYGCIEGYVKVNEESFYLEMGSFRIHSYGKQGDWRNVHKYNLHMFSTENGDRFTVGEFCFPLTLSSYKMGFVYSDIDKKVYPITYNDFQLYQHGESGNPPSDYAFTIEAGGRTYTIKVDVIDSPHFYISEDWECKIFHRLCSFKVNSAKGWGTSECQQRNMMRRNISNSQENATRAMQSNQRQNNTHQKLGDNLRGINLNATSDVSKITLKEEIKEQMPNIEKIETQKYRCEHCEIICDSRVQLWRHLRTHDNTVIL